MQACELSGERPPAFISTRVSREPHPFLPLAEPGFAQACIKHLEAEGQRVQMSTGWGARYLGSRRGKEAREGYSQDNRCQLLF